MLYMYLFSPQEFNKPNSDSCLFPTESITLKQNILQYTAQHLT